MKAAASGNSFYEEMHWRTASVSQFNGVGSIIVHSVTGPAD